MKGISSLIGTQSDITNHDQAHTIKGFMHRIEPSVVKKSKLRFLMFYFLAVNTLPNIPYFENTRCIAFKSCLLG